MTAYAGAVASADHRASEIGVEILRAGGNAVDAAIATNAVLAVTAPHLCGLGGDLFALLHHDGEVVALNASGRSGSGSSAAALRAEGHTAMPFTHDLRSVTVPGCVDGWIALHERAGRTPLGELLEPAAELAEQGSEVSPLLAPHLPKTPLETDDQGLLIRPGVARTLRAIASGGRAAFYEGEFGTGLIALRDGLFTPEDLATPHADWVEPLSTHVWGHRVWTTPPNSQGYLLLLSLAILEGLDLPDDPDDGRWAHLLIEAAHAAGHDRPALLHEGLDAPLGEAEQRRTRVGERHDGPTAPGADGDTTYLCATDAHGNGVSLIQSNAAGLGSLIWEPSTGINLHNRGIGFSLEEGHPAELAPGRRPPHTLLPALITRDDGSLRAVLGSMGGDAQPQIVLQLVTRLLRHSQSPGQVIDAGRWRLQGGGTGFDTWGGETSVAVEEGTPWTQELRERGHQVEEAAYSGAFGHAHMIEVGADTNPAADPRAVIGGASKA